MLNNNFEIKRIIITGATGGPGQALIRYMLNLGVEITVLCRKNSGRLKYVPIDKRIDIISCELKDLENLVIENKKYDVFFHLGWDFTNRNGRDDVFLQQLNIKYTLDAVNLAERIGCKAFLGCGSQAEYGIVNKKLSSDTKCTPYLAYGMAKLCAGQMAKNACVKKGIKFNWLRVLSVYGPFDNPYNIINKVIIDNYLGEVSELTKCEQIWDLLYNEDLADAFYRVACYGEDGETYVVGSGREFTLREQLETLSELLGNNCKLVFGAFPYPEWQTMYLVADNSKIEKDTGWKSRTSLQEGLRKTIDNMNGFLTLYGDNIYETYFKPGTRFEMR